MPLALEHMLTACTEQHRDLEAYLSELSFASCSTVNRSTKRTPAILTFERAATPIDYVQRASGSGFRFLGP